MPDARATFVSVDVAAVPSPDEMPAYVGNPLAGDPIWEASSALELRIAITTNGPFRPDAPFARP
jgi:hypothetical protein